MEINAQANNSTPPLRTLERESAKQAAATSSSNASQTSDANNALAQT